MTNSFPMARARTAASLLLVLLAGAPFVLAACEAETGPDAPPRKNGCIDLECPPVQTAAPPTTGSGDGGGDAA